MPSAVVFESCVPFAVCRTRACAFSPCPASGPASPVFPLSPLSSSPFYSRLTHPSSPFYTLLGPTALSFILRFFLGHPPFISVDCLLERKIIKKISREPPRRLARFRIFDFTFRDAGPWGFIALVGKRKQPLRITSTSRREFLESGLPAISSISGRSGRRSLSNSSAEFRRRTDVALISTELASISTTRSSDAFIKV